MTTVVESSERNVNGDATSVGTQTKETRQEIHDETDASVFENLVNRAKNISSKDRVKAASSVNDEQIVWGSKDAAEYDMRHGRRGVALVFNHATFKRGSPRRGTEKDCRDISRQLTELGFQVKVHNDLEYKKLKEVLETTSKEDHSDADCLVVVVMTHGEPGQISARDHPYREEELWKRFTGDKCVSLLGKPKLFFIQACRGDLVDDGIRVVATVTDSSPVATYMIPTQADILLSYATVNGYRSWRGPETGSWYIQALCEELSVHGRTRDILTILTFVNRRVAVDCMSNVANVPSLNMKIQMPAFTSMLTRLVIFRNKTKKKTKKKSRECISPDEGINEEEEHDFEGDDVRDETLEARTSTESEDEVGTPFANQAERMRTVERFEQSQDPRASYGNETKEKQVSNREVVTSIETVL